MTDPLWAAKGLRIAKNFQATGFQERSADFADLGIAVWVVSEQPGLI